MAAGFSHLSVNGYRRLRAVELPLRPLNVLIGANGVGKSSVLDVLGLLSGSAEGVLEHCIATWGGLPSLLTADGSVEMTLAVRAAEAGADGLGYQLRLSSKGYGYSVSRETLAFCPDPAGAAAVTYIEAAGERVRYQHEGKLIEPSWDYKWPETALSQVPRMYPEAERFRRRLADISDVYHELDISPRAPIRMPQRLSSAQIPGTDGEDLLPCLYTIRETEPFRFKAIEDALKAAFPSFDRLELPPQSGLLTLGWRDRNFTRPIFANELSEGTLRFLWLATLLQSPGLPQVTLIDEPEVSLHPELLRLLAELMREASDRTQLVVATHSDRFVRFLKPEELIVCDLDATGGMTAQRADALDLSAWLQDYTLDELWSKGVLGGRA